MAKPRGPSCGRRNEQAGDKATLVLPLHRSPVGLDCETKERAMTVAHDIARRIAIDVGSRSARHVVIVDDDGIELFKSPVEL
jgi:hypothetical protein